MSISLPVSEFEDQKNIIFYLMDLNLLKKNVNCHKCNFLMLLKNYKCIDKFIWRCEKSCRTKKSIRNNSIFQNSKINLKVLLNIIFYFSKNLSPKKCSSILEIEVTCVKYWYNVFRKKIYENQNCINNIKIGGYGNIIEIDECQICRRKNRKGRIPNEIWLFGGVNRNDKNELFIFPIPNRKKQTLMNENIYHIQIG